MPNIEVRYENETGVEQSLIGRIKMDPQGVVQVWGTEDSDPATDSVPFNKVVKITANGQTIYERDQ